MFGKKFWKWLCAFAASAFLVGALFFGTAGSNHVPFPYVYGDRGGNYPLLTTWGLRVLQCDLSKGWYSCPDWWYTYHTPTLSFRRNSNGLQVDGVVISQTTFRDMVRLAVSRWNTDHEDALFAIGTSTSSVAGTLDGRRVISGGILDPNMLGATFRWPGTKDSFGYTCGGEVDIMINTERNAYWSAVFSPGSLDILSVIIHELGHTLGLAEWKDGRVMYPSLGFNENRRYPNCHDLWWMWTAAEDAYVPCDGSNILPPSMCTPPY